MAVVEFTWGFTPPRARPSVGRRVAIAAIALGTLAVLGADLFILMQRNVTTKVSLADAVARLHRARSEGAPAPALASAPAPPAATPVTAVASAKDAPRTGPAARSQPRPTVPVAPGVPVHAPSTPQPYELPPEGVYAYRTTGGETISVAGASHSYPSETYASVRHLGGCRWQNENDVVKEHVDTRTLCSERARFSQLAQARRVTFFGKTDGGSFTCDPPLVEHEVAEVPGTTITGSCAEGSSSARIEVTYLGHGQRIVGGVTVDAVHLQMHSTMTGRARGSEDEEFWMLSTNGLVLEWTRSIDTLADAAFGANVRYQEHATFVLESISPRG